jgi:Na+/proline symporter
MRTRVRLPVTSPPSEPVNEPAVVAVAALPLMFWIQSSLILLAVAAFLVAPLIVAIKAWRRGPPGNEFSGVVAAVLAALVVLTLDLLAAEERWHIAKVKLYWLPDTFGFFICSLIGYLALIPIYLGLSLALFSEIAEVRKQQRLATITPTNDVYSDL